MKNELAGFEQDMLKLEDILDRMNSDEVTLDESIRLYAQAAQLVERCNKGLRQAQVQIDEIDEKLAELREKDAL